MTIWSWVIQAVNFVWSDPEMSRESGNFCQWSSYCLGLVGVAHTANDSGFANCVLNARTSSPNCRASSVMSVSSCRRSCSVPTVPGILLASFSSRVNISGCRSNIEWSHSGGINCCACWSVMCFCMVMICVGWSHTICTNTPDSVYGATPLITSCPLSRTAYLSEQLISIRFLLMIPPMMALWSADIIATRSCSSDPDIPTDQAHPPMPIVCVNLTGCWSRRINNDQRHWCRVCHGCCCWCVSFHWVRAQTVVSFPLTQFLWMAGEPHVGAPVLGLAISKHRVIKFQDSCVSNCFWAIGILRGGNLQLFPEVSRQGEVVYLTIQQSFDITKSVQMFRFRPGRVSSGKLKPIPSGSTHTVGLSHLIMGIGVVTDRYHIW